MDDLLQKARRNRLRALTQVRDMHTNVFHDPDRERGPNGHADSVLRTLTGEAETGRREARFVEIRRRSPRTALRRAELRGEIRDGADCMA